ncbi:MAG: GTP 3',8-cyclase MoaA [Lachnospiraceae bacterium]|nr:GTP 3',8-cyclase MoaA [Lachnospiraceae bacterium]
MKDKFGREIDYLRISVTDHCNLRCRYCIPDGIQLVPMHDLLTYEEIEKVCRCGAELGISKLKVTGGEPLVRKGVARLIGMLKRIPGISSVTLTTNGVLLEECLDDLKAEGLDGVNISLDTLDPERYREITGRDELAQVLAGVDKAVKSGIRTKINVVLSEFIRDQDWKGLAELAKETPLDVRFIELMPIGAGALVAGYSNVDVFGKIQELYGTAKKDEREHGNGPAVYYQLPGFTGSIGLISAIHGNFCHHCNRLRMSAGGELKSCLCYEDIIPLRGLLREGNREDVKEAFVRAICEKRSAHCFYNIQKVTEKKYMAGIGG